MKYSAYGFRKGQTPNNNERLFDGTAGCWGMIAGSYVSSYYVVNEITYYTRHDKFTGGSFNLLKPERMTHEAFMAQCVDAINEGYLEYEISTDPTEGIVVKFKNLHDKLRQRTMWILFTLRSFIEFNNNPQINGAILVKASKMSLTLREKIILSQLFYLTNVPQKLGTVQMALQFYLSGGNATYFSQATLADFRGLLRGGKYFTGTPISKMTWGEGGGYYSNQDVQNTSRTACSGTFEAMRDGERNNVLDLLNKMVRPSRQSAGLMDVDKAFRKIVRFVKYYKKD